MSGSRESEVAFFTEEGKKIHQQFHGQALRHRTLPNHLQHRWPEVFRRVTFDPHTRTVLDERDRKGLIKSLASSLEFDKIEIDEDVAVQYLGLQESGIAEAKDIMKIETIETLERSSGRSLIERLSIIVVHERLRVQSA